MNKKRKAMTDKIDVEFHCGMKIAIILGADGPKFEEHPRCEGRGIMKGVDAEHLLRSKTSSLNHAESELQVVCPECGMLLNWFSGHFKEVVRT